MPKKPRFVQILLATVILVFERWRLLGKAILVPLVLFLISDAVAVYANSYFVGWLLYFVNFAIYTILAVAVHRLILLGPGSVDEYGVARSWSRRETRFLGYLFFLGVISVICYPLIWLIPLWWVWLIFALVAGYLWARFSILFPATAIDEPIDIRTAWSVSSNHQWLLVVMFVFVPLIFGAAPTLLFRWLDVHWVLQSLVGNVELVFIVAALSLTYEPPRDSRRLFCLSHAAMACSPSFA